MRTLLVLFLLSPAAFADSGEIEIAGGYGGAVLDSSVGAPVVSVRAGVDAERFFSPGIRVTAVLGPEPQLESRAGIDINPASNRGWSVMAEARFHTPGQVQAILDLGAGLGRLVAAGDENSATVGDFAPAFQIGLGGRAFVVPGLAVGLQLLVPIWTGTHLALPVRFSPPPPEKELIVGAALCGSITFHFGG